MDLSKLFTLKTVKNVEMSSHPLEKGSEPFLNQTTSNLTAFRPKETEKRSNKTSTSSKGANEAVPEEGKIPPHSSEQTQSDDIVPKKRKGKKKVKETEPRKSPRLENTTIVKIKESIPQDEKSSSPPPVETDVRPASPLALHPFLILIEALMMQQLF
jgi:hypothetical protein